MSWSGAGRQRGRLHEALVESKAAVNSLRDGLAVTSRELALERKQLEDAERRGQLAAAIPDHETVEIATRFAARHRERVGVLERKLAVQQDELALAERLLAELMSEARGAPPAQEPPVQPGDAAGPAAGRRGGRAAQAPDGPGGAGGRRGCPAGVPQEEDGEGVRAGPGERGEGSGER